MTGIELRMERLFGNGSLFLAALDHGQYMGVPQGLENVERVLEVVRDAPFDGVILNPGIAGTLKKVDAKKLLILRATHAGTKLSGTSGDNRLFLRPRDALCLGADAVITMVILGQTGDVTELDELARAVSEYHRYGIPVIGEILPADPEKHGDAQSIADICRIAAEIGADVIKTSYAEPFSTIAQGCPVPVIIAGGPKGSDLQEQISLAMAGGARGLAVGRNFYQHADPQGFARNLSIALGRDAR